MNVIMPEMGEGVIEGTIGRWLKSVGDAVEKYDPILEIETDKVTTEAVAEQAGVVEQILVQKGETVPVGTLLAVIGAGDATPVAQPVGAAVAETAAPVKVGRVNGSAPVIKPRNALGRITPVVARMADEHNLDLTLITGTGRNGRITKKDVLAFMDNTPLAAAAPAVVQSVPTVARVVPPPAAKPPKPPIVAPATGDAVQPLSSMRRAIADHMVMSKRTSPHVTTVFEADFTAVMAHYRANKAAFAQNGVRLTLTPYTIMAAAAALRAHPQVNSSWRDDGLLFRSTVNVGMATAIEQGLIVPVIASADELNLLGMARRVTDLAERARTNRLQPNEVQGGTFTVTNHGVSGSLFATPIINQPQCGILGVGKIEKRVVVRTVDGQDMMAIRPMSYLSFTFDHRILDGASADAFVNTFKQTVENWSMS